MEVDSLQVLAMKYSLSCRTEMAPKISVSPLASSLQGTTILSTMQGKSPQICWVLNFLVMTEPGILSSQGFKLAKEWGVVFKSTSHTPSAIGESSNNVYYKGESPVTPHVNKFMWSGKIQLCKIIFWDLVECILKHPVFHQVQWP